MIQMSCKVPTPLNASPRLFNIVVHAQYPHDPLAFTQGLIYKDGYFYESTGLYGHSSLRKVHKINGKIIKSFSLDKQYFAEGITFWNDDIIQLTWQSGLGFFYQEGPEAFIKQQEEFHYTTEGWGLTSNDKHWIMSDGSEYLYLIDPSNHHMINKVKVTLEGMVVKNINELEYIDGQIYANIWMKNEIYIIDPVNGHVTGIVYVDLKTLFAEKKVSFLEDEVLNGIAYDPESKKIFITGKHWPKMFEISLEEI